MKFRRFVSAPGLIEVLRNRFGRIKDGRSSTHITYSLADTLIAAFAMFSLKYPSLLQFDRDARGEDARSSNLRKVFGLDGIPSDTQMRAIIDPVAPENLHRGIKDVIAHLQQGKILDTYKFLDDSLLVSGDGTGLFSSESVHCDNCCSKKSRSGSVRYYHQGFSLVIAHPQISSVLPICLETISKEDGATKNDCELNAAKRALRKLRREHPHLRMRILLDGLFAKAPIVDLARELKFGFIIIARDGDHRALIKHLGEAKYTADGQFHSIVEHQAKKVVQHDFFFCNSVPLNDSNPNTLVNVLEYTQTLNGKTSRWVWITDLILTKTNVMQVMRAGRTRWRIENETFNVLKNHGYEFEHNFGHGHKNLCTNLFYIMMLAFLVDQVQQLSCKVFLKLLKLAERRKYLWEQMRSVFRVIRCKSIFDFYQEVGRSYDLKFAIDSS